MYTGYIYIYSLCLLRSSRMFIIIARTHTSTDAPCLFIYIYYYHSYILTIYIFIHYDYFVHHPCLSLLHAHIHHYCTHTYINRRAHPTHMPIAICHMRAGDHEETDLALAIRMQTEEMVQDALRASDGGKRRERDDVRYMHVCVYICIYVYMYTYMNIRIFMYTCIHK